MLSGDLYLETLKEYCKFLLENHLHSFVVEDLKRNREVDLPILKLFKQFSEEEIIAMSTESITKYLLDIINDMAVPEVFQSMANWKADKLPGVPKHSLEAADIALIYNTRKHTLFIFLPLFSTDYKLMLKIVNELENFYTFQTNLALQTYAEIKHELILENKKKLKEAQIMANLGNWEYNLTTKKTYWSDQLFTIYGLNKENFPKGITSEEVQEFLIPEDVLTFRKNIQNAIENKGKYSFEFKIKTKNGDEKILLDEGYSSINESGEVIVKGITQDITSKKLTQFELINLNKELVNTNENLKALQKELQSSNEELSDINNQLEERVNIRTLELTKQREYLFSVLMQAPAAIAILKGPELVFEMANPLYYYLIGKSDIIGKTGREAVPEHSNQRMWDFLEKVYKSGEPFYGNEFSVMIDKSGNGIPEQAYFNIVSVPLKKANGEIDGVMVHAVDVSEQVKAVIEAKENASKFKMVLESIPPMAWTALPNGKVNYFSQRWYDYTGLTINEGTDNSWETVLHPDDRTPARDIWNKSRENGEPLEVEHRFYKASTGEYRWHIVKGEPLINEDGIIKLWVGTCTDVHDIKNFSKALEENEKQLRLITNNIPAYVSYVDNNEKYVFANKYYHNLKFTVDSIEGKYLGEVLGNNYKNSKSNISKVLDGEEVSFLSVLNLKDNTQRNLEVKYVPDFDLDGKVKGFVVLGVDLTERLEIESSLEKKNADLEKINADLDNFIYTASHDLKAPVSNIEGLIITLCDSLQEKSFDDEEITNIIQMVNTSIKRFQTTIDELTEIGKTQKNIYENIELINLKEVFEEVCLGIDKQIKDSDATIITDFNCGLINFSKINIKSIFSNLITNSIKYKSPLRKPIIIAKCIDKKDNYIIEIRDNGLGLKKEYQGKIFGMFKRFHDHVEGSGVGLYLVKRIIDNANGTIEVESKEGEGTTFRITLQKNQSMN